jgi:hypothetical protein
VAKKELKMAKFKVGDFVKHVNNGDSGRILDIVEYRALETDYTVDCNEGENNPVYNESDLVLMVENPESNKVELKDHRETETIVTVSKYPVLMRLNGDKDVIVMFISPKTGMVVKSDNMFISVGDYMDHWQESTFSPYKGDIVLTNGD